jgi:7-keto-8-aminopelargonate synthetase-like enzyme
MQAAAVLLEQGVFIQGIRPPTVPVGQCRLRGTVMATHDPNELASAANMIVAAVKKDC